MIKIQNYWQAKAGISWEGNAPLLPFGFVAASNIFDRGSPTKFHRLPLLLIIIVIALIKSTKQFISTRNKYQNIHYCKFFFP